MKRHPLARLSFTIMGNKSSALEKARSRLVLLSAFFIIAYLVVAIRMFDLMILQGMFFVDENITQEKQAISTLAPKEMRRADIVDRNGVLLATSLKTASLFADPKLVVDAQETAKELAKLFSSQSYESYLEKLQKKNRFVWLKRNLIPSEQNKIMLIGDPGLAFREEYQRVYPQGELVSHTIGYVSQDNKGLAGLERAFQPLLSENKKEVSLKTTLDVRLQHALRQEIQNTIEKFSAKAGTGLIMDVNNGDVLAMVSLPDFDPNVKGKMSDDTAFNRASLGVYELGSVFKIFSTAALVESNDNALTMTFDATEPLKRGRYTIRDYHPEKRILTVPEVFMVSSNIGTALMGESIGTDGLKAFYKKLGLFEKPDTVLPEVGSPLYPRPWRDINTLTASYGHGIAVSPLQLVTAVSTIVNGGYSVRSRFILPEQEKHENTFETASVRVIKEETSQVMRGLLRLVVTDGTARKAEVTGYEVGGKTGTAEKPGAHGYDRNKLISSFVGVFPTSAPKYVVFVAIDEPHGIKESYGYATAGWTAAPAAGRIIKRMASLLGIPPIEKPQQQDETNKLLVSHTEGEAL